MDRILAASATHLLADSASQRRFLIDERVVAENRIRVLAEGSISGVDVQRLTDFYPRKSFDYVQCMEVLEHVPDTRAALEQLTLVARKLVVITSADEAYHGYDDEGNFDEGSQQAVWQRRNPYQRYFGQPLVSDLQELGFEVLVEEKARRQLIAWSGL